MCDFYEESIVHTLPSFPTATAIWFVSPLGLRCAELDNGTFLDWIEALAEVLDLDQLSFWE